MDELADLLEHQVDSESRIAPTVFRKRLETRAKLHRLISADAECDADRIAALANELADDTTFAFGVSGLNIEEIRAAKRNGNFSFTPYEPIDSAAVLASAAQYMHRSSAMEPPRVILCTDCEYRPHGSISQIEETTYSVLLSRHLLTDLFAVCSAIFETAANAHEPTGLGGVSAGLLETDFIQHFQSGEWGAHFPYVLASVAASETYRFARVVPALHASARFRFYGLAVVFLLAHELSHLELGHFRSESGNSSVDQPLRDHLVHSVLPRLNLEFGPGVVDAFWAQCGDAYVREFEADMLALVTTIAAANEMFHSPEMGLAAVATVLATLAWTDRADFYLSTGTDPLRLVGKEKYNSMPLGVDLELFRKFDNWPDRDHPWGKTRLMALGIYLPQVSKLGIFTHRLEAIRGMVQNVNSPFTLAMPEAMAILTWVSQKGGEFMATAKGRMVSTSHWPDIHGAPDTVFRFFTPMDDLYGMRNQLEID
jgi:hypothetical protein